MSKITRIYEVLLLFIILSMFAISISACTSQSKVEKKESNNSKTAKLYSKVLDDITKYTFYDKDAYSNIETSPKDYSYALINMDKTDIPQLIVSFNGKSDLTADITPSARIFTPDSKYNNILSTEEYIQHGSAVVGGFRGSINVSKDNDGLLYVAWSSGTGAATEEKITINETNKDNIILKHEKVWEGRIDQLPKDESKDIKYTPIKDRKQLDILAKTKDGKYKKLVASKEKDNDKKSEKENNTEKNTVKDNTQNEANNKANELETKIQAEKAAGNIIFSGTVKYLTCAQLAQLPQKDPVPDDICSTDNQMYVILVLDSQIAVNARNIAGQGTKTEPTNMVALPASFSQYANQHVNISIQPGALWWQSDVSLPMGELRTNDSAGEIKLIG